MQYYILLFSLLLCIYIIATNIDTQNHHIWLFAWDACCSTMSHVSRDSSKYWVHQALMHTLCGSHLKRALYPERALCPRRRALCPRRRALCLEHAGHIGWVHDWCAHTTRKRSSSTFSPRRMGNGIQETTRCTSATVSAMHERNGVCEADDAIRLHERCMLRGGS